MSEIKIITDREGAVAVMKETAVWAKKKGIVMTGSWRDEKLNAEHIMKKLGAKDSDFLVFTLDGKVCGSCILQDRDAFNEWKKYGYGDRHYYISKFAITDGFHGGDAARKMLDALKEKCVADGFKSIRLVAESKIAHIYINAGFFPHWSFKGGKTGKTFLRLAWYRWTPEEYETIWRGAGRLNLRRFAYLMLKRILWFL